jgi:hypothetical protein
MKTGRKVRRKKELKEREREVMNYWNREKQ